MAPKVLLVELGDSHGECLFTQAEALRERGLAFGLVLHERQRGRLHPAVLHGAPAEFLPCDRLRDHLRAAWRIRRLVAREGYSHVVVNTASGNAVRWVAALLPAAARAVGVVHNACKLGRSGTQALIGRRFRDYLVLADHLVPTAARGGGRVGAFYPICFPAQARAEAGAAAIAGERGPFRIVVPGSVSYSRRDYRGLVALWRSVPEAERAGISVELLGNLDAGDGPDLLALLRREGLEDAFVLHRGYVDEDAFYARLAAADAVLPLLHPGAADFESYRRCKISGSFNLAYGFHKPLLVHASLREIPDFQRTAVFYELPRLPALAELRAARDRIAAEYARSRTFDPAAQRARWAEFVLGPA